jgi:hypothetical protein
MLAQGMEGFISHGHSTNWLIIMGVGVQMSSGSIATIDEIAINFVGINRKVIRGCGGAIYVRYIITLVLQLPKMVL